MGENVIIVLGLVVVYDIYKTISKIEAKHGGKIQILETKVRELNAKLRYGDLWWEGLDIETQRDEVRLWEEQLDKAHLKWFGSENARVYAEQRIEEAKEMLREAIQNFKDAQKRSKGNKT